MKKILLLTDFSKASERAIYFAQTLFDNTAAEFRILNTFPLATDLMYGTTVELDSAEEDAQQQLKTLLAEVTSQPVPAYHHYLTQTHISEPVMAVEYLLEQNHIDYVVVGASGSHKSELFGSTATGIIRNCTTNILVIPAFTPIRPLNEVVLAADINSINDLKTLQPLKDVLEAKNARLTLLTIVNKHSTITADEIEAQRQRVADFLSSTQVESYIIHDDKVERGINDYLKTHEVELLVTIPHQKSLFDVLMGNSITRKLAFNPQVPLLALYDPKPVFRQPANSEEIVVGGLMLY